MKYQCSIPIRFGDTDPAGVVYYPNYFHYYHSAFEEFFGDCHGVPYHQWIGPRQVGFPTVNVEATFRSPLRFGENLQVEVSIPKVGERSVVFRFRAMVAQRLAGEARITKACVHMGTFESQSIPEELRTVFQKYDDSESMDREHDG